MYFLRSFLAAAAVCLAQAVAAASSLEPRSLSGEATFYGGNVAGGACSFSTYTLPSGVFGTALSDSNWDNLGNCGACISVTGPAGNSTTAMIVDECPGCGVNHLDLFPDAFSTLANPGTGVIDVTWEYIDCSISSPLQVHNKEGVSAYWFSMQVVNANKPVGSLEVSTDGGSSWQSTARQTYNFFENLSGFGTTTVDVKVTSVDGDVVIINDVTVSSGVSVTATSNFGPTSSSGQEDVSSISQASATSAPTTGFPSSSTSSELQVTTSVVSTKSPVSSTPASTTKAISKLPISKSLEATRASSTSVSAVFLQAPSSTTLAIVTATKSSASVYSYSFAVSSFFATPTMTSLGPDNILTVFVNDAC